MTRPSLTILSQIAMAPALLLVQFSATDALSQTDESCPLRRAIYSNPDIPDGPGGYDVIFNSGDGPITEIGFTLASKDALTLQGSVTWSVGASRPYASVTLKCSAIPETAPVKCTGDEDQKEFYSGEIYGLDLAADGKITTSFPAADDRAPASILLPNLSATLYMLLRPPSPVPFDLFHLSGCSKTE
jgi:hypothetical protein